jgi:HlyD family secretion protein
MSHISSRKKKIIPLLILVMIISVAVYFYGQNKQTYTGVIEATILSNTAEISGKILEMPVELGQHVSKGDIIAKLDNTDQNYAYEQLQLTLDKKKLALSQLQIGSGSTQANNSVDIAQANYSSASSSSRKAAQDYQKAQSLFDQGAISQDALDSAKVKADTASSALASAKAQLDNAMNQSSASSMELDVQQTESQLAEMKNTLDKFTIKAVSDGVIMSKSYVVGDMVAAGYNLADIATDGGKYFVFYLPIDYVNSINYDQTMTIKASSKKYDAVVKYIDVESEYTPKDMQTPANKNKESVKIKLLLPKGCPLKPGQEATLHLDLKKS